MCQGLEEELCAEPVVVVGALTVGSGCLLGAYTCHPWSVGCYFLLQTDLYVHRTSPTRLVSLPKSVSDSVQSVGPAGFGLGLASFS